MRSTAIQSWIRSRLQPDSPLVQYAHLPLIDGEDGRRLSKRFGSADMQMLRQGGWSARQVIGVCGWLLGLLNRPEPVRAEELLDRFTWNFLADNHEDRRFDPEELEPNSGYMKPDRCCHGLRIDRAPVSFGLLDGHPDLKEFAGRRLAQLVRDRDYTVGTGFAGTPYVLPALTETGHLEEAYRLFLSEKCPSWLYQVSMGATTTWERWDSMLPDGKVNSGVGMTSFNHYALGSVAEWMYSTLGGLVMTTPGWERFKVAPKPWGPIRNAHVTHKTALGIIDLAWKYEADDGQLIIDVSVPEGSSALVEMGEQSELIHAGSHRLVYAYTV